jgi:lipid-binding SYLF domain-containing protein
MKITSKWKYTAGLTLATIALLAARTASADSLTSDSRAALQQLVSQNPAAARVKAKSQAILVFPDVVKAGFIFGAQGGKGILFMHGQPSGRYRTVAASYGLQAGVQKYGYALFLMNQKAVDWVNNTRGWEIGTGPSVVIVDKGMARSLTTDTLHSGIYAFTFDQKGLMAGLGLQGSKIMRLDE